MSGCQWMQIVLRMKDSGLARLGSAAAKMLPLVMGDVFGVLLLGSGKLSG